MPIAMLVTLVAVSAGAVATPLVLGQVTDTRTTVRTGDVLQAASDGLEAAVASVRAAVVQGSPAKLPCFDDPTKAIVEPAGDPDSREGAFYSVTLKYYSADPALPAQAPITSCATVHGAFPEYVRLTSTGTPRSSVAGEGRRSLQGDYEIRPVTSGAGPNTGTGPTSLAPTPSATWGPEYDDFVNPRPIMAYTTTRGDEKCLDPGSQRPAPGTGVTLETCNSGNVQDNGFRQNWYYREDLTLALVAGILSGTAMCLDAGPLPVAGVKVTTQPCLSPPPMRQRWYYNEFGNYEMARAKGINPKDAELSGLCLNVESPGRIGSPIVLGGGANCRSKTFSSRQTFSTYTKIGPGQAGSRTLDCTADAGYPCVATQLVNNGMPSRCIDRYTTFMANMECVQAPELAAVRWTQLWRLPQWADGPAGVVGPIVAFDPVGRNPYCLTTATTWPTLAACDPKKPTTAQKWRIYRRTGNDYTQFRIVDANGRCLTHPNGSSSVGSSAQFYWNQASYHWKLIVDTCINASNDPNSVDRFNQASVLRRQKWNAPMLLAAKTPVSPSPTAASPTTAAPMPTLPSTSPSPSPSPSSSSSSPPPSSPVVLHNLTRVDPPAWTGPPHG
ncbi:hypothetical protein GCM10010166_64740 [Couchioplanes caeruleus subsp. azureus]|nr:hypothetical protein GCM10010166_64740 [Couchioplanes caeruleus subsp. azureus]